MNQPIPALTNHPNVTDDHFQAGPTHCTGSTSWNTFTNFDPLKISYVLYCYEHTLAEIYSHDHNQIIPCMGTLTALINDRTLSSQPI